MSDDEFSDGGSDQMDRFSRNRDPDEDEDFDFDGEPMSAEPSPMNKQGPPGQKLQTQKVVNQPYDEAVEVSDTESDHASTIQSPGSSPMHNQVMSKSLSSVNASTQPKQTLLSMDSRADSPQYDDDPSPTHSQQYVGASLASLPERASMDSTAVSQSLKRDDFQGSGSSAGSGGYSPPPNAAVSGMGDFGGGQISPEIKELFTFISAYKPPTIELETRIKPFVPEFIPAVGDIDAFIKIPRPDKKPDGLGLTVLDEPCANQSDPTVLELQLRSTAKQSVAQPASVRSIEHAEKNPKAIATWINSISDLHRVKPPPNVTYSKPMPDIETLMQVWPPEFEDALSLTELPSADLDVDLLTYVKIVCSVLDIPVHANAVESLHVLFTLYSEFKANQHFLQQTDVSGSPPPY